MKINANSINKNQTNTLYPVIDLTKLIAAVLVMAIHIAPFGTNPVYGQYNFMIKQYLTRWAVPFFFVCSGFFLYRKCDIGNYKFNNCLPYVKKLLRLYLTWTVIYSFYIIKNITHGRKTITKVILETIFSGSYLHLWYFTALITGIILVSWLISKKIRPVKILLISGIFYLIGLLGQAYFVLLFAHENNPVVSFIIEWYPKIFVNTRNGLFEGFFFVSIGMLFATCNIKIPFKLALSGTVISEILLIIETTIVDKHGWHMEEDLFLSLIPLVFFLFYVLSHIEFDSSKSAPVYSHFRILSSMIFYLHLFVYASYKQIITFLGLPFNDEGSVFLPVLLITVLCSEIIIFLSKKKPFKLLQKLYS